MNQALSLLGISLGMVWVSEGGVRSGHAELELLKGSDAYAAGKPITLGIELSMDEGWHTYWVNPGEGGMKPAVSWVLPEGWVAGPVLYPMPKRFMTGELPGYGYEEKVILPVFITPAADATGPAKVGVKVNWLTCGDDACVPGSGEVTVDLDSGPGGPGPDAKALSEALAQVPEPLNEAKLEVKRANGRLTLEISLPDGVDATGAEVFPATPAALDHGQPIRLERVGDGWRAQVAVNEYAPEEIENLEVVLGGGALGRPLLLKWSATE